MRALKAAVVVMGVLIVVGVAVLAVALTRTLFAPAGASMQALLEEPAGTRIAMATALPDRLMLQLAGGGPDRVVVLDLRSGRVIARAALAR